MVTLHTRHSSTWKVYIKMVYAYIVVLYDMSRIHPLPENDAVSANGPRMHVKRSSLWPRPFMTFMGVITCRQHSNTLPLHFPVPNVLACTIIMRAVHNTNTRSNPTRWTQSLVLNFLEHIQFPYCCRYSHWCGHIHFNHYFGIYVMNYSLLIYKVVA